MIDHDTKSDPILIVGAGPTGLMLALELSKRGVPCRIIDQLLEPSDKSKALGIVPRNLETFEDLGLIDVFLERGKKMPNFCFHMGGKEIDFSFSHLETYYPYMLVLPQCETEKILTEELSKHGVSIERGVQLNDFSQDSEGVTAIVMRPDESSESIRASWMVGCDGASSLTRKITGLQFGGETYRQTFALADVNIIGQFNHHEMHAFISERGQFVIFPMPGGYERLIIVDMPISAMRNPREPSLQEIQSILDERSPVKLHLQNPRWLSSFQIHKCRASAYRKNRVFIAGDAAHIHSPAGAQGMNTGMQDALNLSWKLALVWQGKAFPEFLDSYEKERMPVAEEVLAVTDEMTKMMATQSLFHRLLRKLIATMLLPREGFQRIMTTKISQLEINYHHSPIVQQPAKEKQIGHGLRAGDKVVDVQGLVTREKKQQRLFELLAGKEHQLLLFSGTNLLGAPIDELHQFSDQVEKEYPGMFTSAMILGGEILGSTEVKARDIIMDPLLLLHNRWGVREPAFFLIRPDKYIAYRGSLSEKELFLNYLKKWYHNQVAALPSGRD